MRLVYKINLFADRIGRVTKLLMGIVMALVIVFLFAKNNDLQEDSTEDQTLINHTIQRSVDTTAAQIQRFIKTINPTK
jgi:hypothetical protein